MKLLCRLGFHKYTRREVHVAEKLTGFQFIACIIERCDCGESRISSGDMPTTVVIPKKYERDYEL